MGRADDRGGQATTRALAAPRVTLNWQAEPFTTRGKRETKWLREKNGRRVLQLSHGGHKRYWRAPKPRPKPSRRQKRRQKAGIVRDALSPTESVLPPPASDPAVTIQVLQAALRASIERERKLNTKLQQREAGHYRHAKELDRLVPQAPGDELLPRNHQAESGYVGVTRNKGGWAAHTSRYNGNRIHLGTYDTPLEAARARAGLENLQAQVEVEDAEWEAMCATVAPSQPDQLPWRSYLIVAVLFYIMAAYMQQAIMSRFKP